MTLSTGTQGSLSDAKAPYSDGDEFTVVKASATGTTLLAVPAAAPDAPPVKFVQRKDGAFRMTGHRAGNNLVLSPAPAPEA